MKKRTLPPPQEMRIDSLTPEGRGLGRLDGKAVFIDGALPGERVRVQLRRRHRQFDEGEVLQVLEPAPQRVSPRCPHFGVCGGCRLQHLDTQAQILLKQESLGETLRRIGHVEPARWLEPLRGDHWGYRRKARLGVRWVKKKGRTLVGFRERQSAFLADLHRCEVLHPSLGERLDELAALVDALSIRTQIPQIEIAKGEAGPCALVFRVLKPPSEADRRLLEDFQARGFALYLQEAGPESVRPLSGSGVSLFYDLPTWDLRIHFAPLDFTQVHFSLNRRMVDQALALLDPQPQERVLDLFCGLGNFSLPLARRSAEVLGIEGDEGLVAQARDNARRNGLGNIRFQAADLQVQEALSGLSGPFHKALLDPPRSGALALLDRLPLLGVQRVLYVSCFPATLARDADRLVNHLGYRLEALGVMDLFPHTAHVEAMALFERDEGIP